MTLEKGWLAAATLALVALGVDASISTSKEPLQEIIDASGDGAGGLLDGPLGVAVDTSNDVLVVGHLSDNAFPIQLGLFADGLESGDTSAWTSTVP